MTSWLRGTSELKHVTKLPAGISSDRAIEVLHDHAAFISCDPHLIKHEPIARPSDAADALPDRCSGDAIGDGEARFYSVTDKVQKLPAGLWDSEVVSVNEMVNLKRGLFVRLRSPLSVVMETTWDVAEDSAGSVTLTETVVIKAPRLLVGIAKGMCESDWKGIHESFVKIMSGEKKL